MRTRLPLAARTTAVVLILAWTVTVPLAVWALTDAATALGVALTITAARFVAADVRAGRYALGARAPFEAISGRYREQVIDGWTEVMTAAGLVLTDSPDPQWWQGLSSPIDKVRRAIGYLTNTADDYPPTLLALTEVAVGVRANVRMLRGQKVADYRGAADALAPMWRAREVRVAAGEPGQVVLTIVTRDPLAAAVPPPAAMPAAANHGSGSFCSPAPMTPVDLHAVPVGVTEDGEPWTLAVLDQPGILISGVPGAGKSALLTTLVHALGGHPHVRIDGIDMKGGVDLTPVHRAGLITTLATDPAQALTVLQKLWHEHTWRQDVLLDHDATKVSDIGVSADLPLRVLVIDEAADLFTPLSSSREDKAVTAEITMLVSTLIRQGRATGITTVVCTQKATVDAVPGQARDAATARIALRCATPEQARAALGDAYEAAPISPTAISVSTPGIAIAAHTGGPRAQPGGDVQRVRVYDASAHLTHAPRPAGPPRPRPSEDPTDHPGGQCAYDPGDRHQAQTNEQETS